MMRIFNALLMCSFLAVAACNAANQGPGATSNPSQPEPGSPAAQLQQK